MKFFVKEILKSPIMWLKDTGILDKVKYDVLKPPIPDPNPTVKPKPLILRQLGIIMIILVVGLFVATIVFFVELVERPKLKNASEAEDGFEMTKVHDAYSNYY